jgi:hypothetical protein
MRIAAADFIVVDAEELCKYAEQPDEDISAAAFQPPRGRGGRPRLPAFGSAAFITD